MASIVKYRDKWRAHVRRKGEKAISKTFRTKAEAETWAREIEYKVDTGGYTPPTSETVKDIMVRYRDEVSCKHKGAKWEKTRINLIVETWSGVTKLASELNRYDIQRWRDIRLAQVSPSSVNRELNILSAVFNYAMKEWGVRIKHNPVQEIKRPQNAKPRNKRVPDELMAGLYRLLGDKHGTVGWYLPYVVEFAVETAMRMSEITGIEWCDVHIDKSYVRLWDTKNGDSRDVPLSSRAKEIIKSMPTGTDKVFNIKSGVVSTYFRKYTKQLGYTDIRFHDTRHEGATRLSKKLSNVLELSAVTGHRDLRSLHTYYNPTASEIAAKLD